MGLFRKLGKQVEKFKHDAKNAASEAAAYECATCGARFHTPQDGCPECGSDDVAPIDAEADDTSIPNPDDSET